MMIRTTKALVQGAAALALLASCTAVSDERAGVDIKGTNPDSPPSRTVPPTGSDTATPPGGGASSGEILDHGTYRSVVAKDGDTVASLAARSGLSASAIGAYNGLKPDHKLAKGDELILPPDAKAATGGGGGATDKTGGTDGTGAKDGGKDTGTAATGGDGKWSPDLAAAAIRRSKTGVRKDGSLGAPPSSTDKVPAAPKKPRDLVPPKLGKYRTSASDPASGGDGRTKPGTDTGEKDTPKPVKSAPKIASTDPAKAGGTDKVTKTPAPSATGGGRKPARTAAAPATLPAISLRRPVRGPVVLGFNKSAGPKRSDGVEFSAPVGTPVVAAADGEVAVITESLGGLGTIVLIRHRDDILTVYGRIERITVDKGALVKRGQTIGVVAAPRRGSPPTLHFEVRQGATVLDPMLFF